MQPSSRFSDFPGFVNFLLDILNPLIVLVAGIALLVFFKGLVSFIAKAGDDKAHKDGRNLMVWGLIALFVMVSILGIVRLMQDDLGFNDTGFPTLPTGTPGQ